MVRVWLWSSVWARTWAIGHECGRRYWCVRDPETRREVLDVRFRHDRRGLHDRARLGARVSACLRAHFRACLRARACLHVRLRGRTRKRLFSY